RGIGSTVALPAAGRAAARRRARLDSSLLRDARAVLLAGTRAEVAFDGEQASLPAGAIRRDVRDAALACRLPEDAVGRVAHESGSADHKTIAPGFDRLRHALELAERLALEPLEAGELEIAYELVAKTFVEAAIRDEERRASSRSIGDASEASAPRIRLVGIEAIVVVVCDVGNGALLLLFALVVGEHPLIVIGIPFGDVQLIEELSKRA